MKSRNRTDDAIRVAVEIATRQAEEMREIRTRIKHKQYRSPQGLADLLQRVCKLVGLAPDPQLIPIPMESATHEAGVNEKRKTA